MAVESRSGLIVGVDFHGVICAHPEGSRGATEPDWPEVPGAIGWLEEVSAFYAVCLISARFGKAAKVGSDAMLAARRWLLAHGLPSALLYSAVGSPRIVMSAYKPACTLWVDDRAWRFDGTFPTVEQIESFKPWNR